MVFKDFCIIVLWTNVASALEGLKYYNYAPYLYHMFLYTLWVTAAQDTE